MQVQAPDSSLIHEIFHALPESVYAKDLNGVYIDCSARMAELAGCSSPAEVIGKTDFDLAWHQHAQELRANDLRVVKEKKTLVFEEQGFTFQNKVLLVRTLKSPLFNAEGEVIGICGISFDISDLVPRAHLLFEKIAAEKALQRAESQYLKQWYREISGQHIVSQLSLDQVANKLKTYVEGIIDKLPANIYWMDLDGHLLGCNQQMAQLTHYVETSEALGKNARDYYIEHQATECIDNNLKVQESQEVLIFEEHAIIDGEERVFLSHKSALRDEQGVPVSIVGVSFDITDRKHMEQELKQAKEEAEAANLSKIHFMNNMRHDLRTPLSCVVGSARVLKAVETDPEKVEFIDGILSSSQHLLQMLTNMLEFDHIQSKEKGVNLTPVKVINLGQNLIDMLTLTAKGKNLSLRLIVAPEVPEVILSDAYRLQRILMNLLNNAIKFTHQGGVILRMGLTEQGVLFSVEDTGIGIDPARKHQVFEKFVRLVDSDKGLYEGEGLGLAIVKQFVTELKGKIECESQPGQGTCFKVMLPVNQGQESVKSQQPLEFA